MPEKEREKLENEEKRRKREKACKDCLKKETRKQRVVVEKIPNILYFIKVHSQEGFFCDADANFPPASQQI